MKKLICLALVLLCLPVVLALDEKFSIRGHDQIYGYKIDLSLWSNGNKGEGHLYFNADGINVRIKLKQEYRNDEFIVYSGKGKIRLITGGRPSIQAYKYDTYVSIWYDGGDTAYLWGYYPIHVDRLR